MKRSGGEGGSNLKGKFNGLTYNAPMPKFLQKLKLDAQHDETKHVREWEEKLAKAEAEGKEEESGKVISGADKTDEERVNMDTFKPKFQSKKERGIASSSSMSALKEEIETRKQIDKEDKLSQLKKIDQPDSKMQRDSRKPETAEEERENKKSSSSITLNMKRRAITESIKHIEAATTAPKKVAKKQGLLSFDDEF